MSSNEPGNGDSSSGMSQENIQHEVDQLMLEFDDLSKMSDRDSKLQRLQQLLALDNRYDFDPDEEQAKEDLPVYLKSARKRLLNNPKGEKVV